MPSYYNPPPLSSDVTYAAIPFRQPFPSIGQAIVLTCMLLGAQFFFGMLLAVLGLPMGRSPAESIGVGALAVGSVLSFAVVLGIGVFWGKLPLREAFPLRPTPITLLPTLAITIVGLSVLLSDLSNLVLLWLPAPEFVRRAFDDMMGAEGPVWQSVVLLVVIAPLTEEPIFRGLMLNGLLLRRRPWVAIFATSVLFAVTHLNPWQFFPALGLGLLFGWWFLRTRSLWPCIVGHALNNALPHIAAAIPGFDVPGYTGFTSDAVVFQPMWFDFVGLVFFITGLAWTWRAFRRMPGLPVARPVEPPRDLPAAGP